MVSADRSLEGELSNKSCEILALRFDLLKQKKYKVEEKYNARIHEYICTTSRTEYTTDRVDEPWKESKKKKSSSDSEKYKKMQSIKSLTSRYTKCDDRYDSTRNYEKYLEKSHEEWRVGSLES